MAFPSSLSDHFLIVSDIFIKIYIFQKDFLLQFFFQKGPQNKIYIYISRAKYVCLDKDITHRAGKLELWRGNGPLEPFGPCAPRISTLKIS